jgi:P27 family predicted phage terminase small subunit
MARPPGKKPLPTFLKLVKGAPKDRINQKEAVPPKGMPTPPKHLSDVARAEWDRIARDLYDIGILTKVDGATLAAYCQAYGRWQQAEELLAEYAERNPSAKGLVVATKSGNIIHNPLLGVANKAMGDMVRFATDLGITPSARSRVAATPPVRGKDDPAAEYFR